MDNPPPYEELTHVHGYTRHNGRRNSFDSHELGNMSAHKSRGKIVCENLESSGPLLLVETPTRPRTTRSQSRKDTLKPEDEKDVIILEDHEPDEEDKENGEPAAKPESEDEHESEESFVDGDSPMASIPDKKEPAKEKSSPAQPSFLKLIAKEKEVEEEVGDESQLVDIPTASSEKLQQAVNEILEKVDHESNNLKQLLGGGQDDIQKALKKIRTGFKTNLEEEKKAITKWIDTLKDQYKTMVQKMSQPLEAVQQLKQTVEQVNKCESAIRALSTVIGEMRSSIQSIEFFIRGKEAASRPPLTSSQQLQPKPEVKNKKLCFLCDTDTHWSLQCRKYRSAEERMKRAEELKLCIKCCGKIGDDQHTSCPNVDTQCTACAPLISVRAYTLHHRVFCCLSINAEDGEQTRKRKNGSSGQNQQAPHGGQPRAKAQNPGTSGFGGGFQTAPPVYFNNGAHPKHQ